MRHSREKGSSQRNHHIECGRRILPFPPATSPSTPPPPFFFFFWLNYFSLYPLNYSTFLPTGNKKLVSMMLSLCCKCEKIGKTTAMVLITVKKIIALVTTITVSHLLPHFQSNNCKTKVTVSVLKHWYNIPCISESRITIFHKKDCLVGLMVAASAFKVEGPGFESRLRQDFSGVESYQWLKNWHSSGYPARRLAL